ncbi:hypothetical protein Pcinc_019504 [Petrolisthes cinctipes]|uniref:Uncharacterized protein n=1 Tax=Petrolisthes cinctipes TaxID=88211 RepID=A0AAE1KMM1_PETCI|nr:hypothetical protein Pcinc_019504 [Petrolisthes cinctipes]
MCTGSHGLADEETRKEVLGTTEIDTKTLNETVCLVDSKETTARAMVTDNLRVAASSYKKMGRGQTNQASPRPTHDYGEQDKMKCKIRCQCGSLTPQFGKVRGRVKEFKLCLECWKKNHPRTHKSSQPESCESMEALFHFVATTEMSSGLSGASPHPTLKLLVAVDVEAYTKMKTPCPPRRSATITAIADSGAQTCLMGLQIMKKLGLRQQQLTQVTKRILAANNEEINVLGAVFLKLSGCNQKGEQLETATVVYVTDSTSRFYLSRAALEQLGVIGPDFPKIGATGPAVCKNTVSTRHLPTLAGCGCPLRTAPPPRPAKLPMVPSPKSTEVMKDWLLERYASTFNICPHQPLPAMTGPPIEIRVDPDVQPVVTRRPPNVPVHWQEEVSEQLKRDVALGVQTRL